MWSTNGLRYLKRDIEVKESWLKTKFHEIQAGRITLKACADNVEATIIDGTEVELKMCPKMLSQIFKEHGYTVFNVGRKGHHKEYEEEKTQIIRSEKLRLKCGITKLWEHLNKDGVGVSRTHVQTVCEDLQLTEKNPKKRNKIRCRYLVSHVNAAWHGDIHYIFCEGETKYLFALIDDRSRYLIEYGLYDQKNQEAVIHTFKEAIEKLGRKPLIYWSDNGGENIGEITAEFCKENGILQCKTLPGNPQSNGKIECWWKPLEKRLKDLNEWDEIEMAIDEYVQIYNTELPHFGLEKINKYHAYPIEIFTNQDLQYSNLEDCTIKIDNRTVIPIKNFLHLE